MNFSRIIALGIVAGACLAAAAAQAQSSPQPRVAKGWKTVRFDGPVLKALLSGTEATAITGGRGQVRVTDFKMITFRNGDENDPELIVEAPECFYSDGLAASAGDLKIYTATTNLFIEGTGFIWRPIENGTELIISNNVHTVIHPEEKEGKPAAVATDEDAQPEPPIEIFADGFRFESIELKDAPQTRKAFYVGNVRLDDPELALTAGTLTVELPVADSKLQYGVAEENVVITNKRDNSQATGGQAIYEMEEDREVIRLSGNPVWREEHGEARAGVFILDRTRKVLRAEGDAYVKLAQESLAQPGLLPSGAAPAAAAEDSFVEVFARTLEIQLPTTNQTARSMIAEEQVIVVNSADDSRATGERATYDEETGLFSITGNASWVSGEQLVRGDLLEMNRAEQLFAATGDAYLRLPVGTMEAGGDSTPAASRPPEFLEVFSDSFEHQTNRATFRGSVRGELLEGADLRSRLNSDFLVAALSPRNQVEHLMAEGSVRLEEFPDLAVHTNFISKEMSCQRLTVTRSPETGWLQQIVAERNVEAEQLERGTTGGLRNKRISAGFLKIDYSPATNRVERMIARQDVVMVQDETSVTGERAVYLNDGENESVEVSGTPVARTPEALITGAEVLIWNPLTGKFSGRGPWKGTRITPVEPDGASRIRQ